MKEFFSHDHNARNDQKLTRLQMKHGMEGIGIFWCICEMLAEEAGYLMRSECERIAYELHTQCDKVKSVIEDFGLFAIDDDKFYSDSMLKRLQVKYDKSEKARKSAEARWKKMADANALQTHSDRNAIKLNKTDSKLNETKQNSSANKNSLVVVSDNLKDTFQIWWDAYGKKRDIKKCRAKWKKYPIEKQREIMKHTMAYVAATPDVQFRKNPLTYLNGENWMDEHMPQPRQTTKKETIDEVFARLRAPIEEKKDHQTLDNRNKYLDLGHENT